MNAKEVLSRAAARAAGMKTYFTGRACAHGHIADRAVSNCNCVECLKAGSRLYHLKNRDERLAYMRKLAKDNPSANAGRSKRWYHASDENKQKTKRYKSLWRSKNVKHVRARGRLYAQNRRDRLVIPAWADRAKIKSIYENCPDGMEVDHVIPIAGRNVCGLHVEYNLQYLTKSANSSKGARWDG